MPETPDFDQIAKSLLLQVAKDLVQTSLARNHVVEQLRVVWNARGAADIAALEAGLPGASMKTLVGVLRLLDR